MWRCVSCDLKCDTLDNLIGHISKQCIGGGVVINFDEKTMTHFECFADVDKVCWDFEERRNWNGKSGNTS